MGKAFRLLFPRLFVDCLQHGIARHDVRAGIEHKFSTRLQHFFGTELFEADADEPVLSQFDSHINVPDQNLSIAGGIAVDNFPVVSDLLVGDVLSSRRRSRLQAVERICAGTRSSCSLLIDLFVRPDDSQAIADRGRKPNIHSALLFASGLC